MDSARHLDALVAPLRADVVSGAAVVARTAAEVVRRASGRVEADSLPELQSALAQVGIRVLDAQPAMAPLLALVRDVLDAVGAASDVEDGRQAAAAAANDFRAGLETRALVLASRASGLLPEDGNIMTLSSSSTVRQVLLHGAQRRRGRVIVLEARPMREGQLAANALAKAGVPVTLAVDAAAHVLVQRCALVLMGVDSVGDLGVVNKLGSAALAASAAAAGVPVMVVTDETKILPTGFPQHYADDRPGEEVWKAPAGVRVWNQYFEPVPLASVDSIVTEAATFTAEEMERHRADIRIPDELRSWAITRFQPPAASGPDR